MAHYPASSRERAMKAQEVILRALSKQITSWRAARILRISPPHLRRIYQRYRQYGFDGLYERRTSRQSPKRVPLEVLERVLALYRETYFDLSVRHFHEEPCEEHGSDLQLNVGQATAARSRPGREGAPAWRASATARTVAHGRAAQEYVSHDLSDGHH